MKWQREVRQLAKELTTADRLIDGGPVERGARILGSLPSDLRNFYRVICKLETDLQKRNVEHVRIHHAGGKRENESACKAFRDAMFKDIERCAAFRELFWSSLRYEFGVQGDTIGIRAGGKVVARKDEESGTGILEIGLNPLDLIELMMASQRSRAEV